MNRKINTPKQRFLRCIAFVLAFVMLSEILFPTAAFALTSMSTQPEVWGYQPVDATDNVSLTSGKFNYTIPVTSIPEYPMAIGYSSGLGMEQEGSVFGFGFSGFSGAIARSMNGLPDDLLGAEKKYDFSNQKMWDASVKGTVGVGAGIGGVPLGLGASVSLQIGYNNYTGAYGAIGLGFGISAKIPGIRIAPAGGIGAGLISDSRESGIRFGAGASVGISYGLYSHNRGGGFESVGAIGVNKVLDNKSSAWKTSASIASSVGKSVFSGTTSNSSSALAPLCYVLPATTGFGASLTVPLPAPIPWNISVTGSYSQFKSGDGEITKDAYGFMYLKDHDRSNRDQISDVTIEGENSFDEKARNAPSYLQKDFFSVNTMGMAGSMQFYQGKNGVVSRNYSRTQYRNFSLPVSIKTERKEVYPWTNVVQSSFKKGLDILALLKKKQNPEDKDFDKILFNEKELLSLNTAKQKFGEAELKMRGDMAGEFDLSSINYKDHSPNKYDLVHVSGSSNNTSVQFLGVEKQMPLYYPSALSEDYSSGSIEKSTQITKRTMSDLISAYSLLNVDPTSPSTSDKDKFNFNQSFYSHYTYSSPAQPTPKVATMVTLGYSGNNMQSMNILQHVHDIDKSLDPNNSAYFKNLIGSIEMRSANGLRYFFNLPVFNKTTKTLQMAGGGVKPPEIVGNDYSSFLKNNGNDKNRNKVTTTDDYMYPYAWLLTAAVGDDYIDFDGIPGPSDGDIGYWVKFKYIKVADNYRWRAPFTGLSHIPMALDNIADDAYVMTEGEKEIYYLSEIESSNYLCNYTYQKRYDALDANGHVNGAAYNSLVENENIGSTTDYTGNNFQFLVTRIDLYKKHNSGDNSAIKTTNGKNLFGTPIKSTKFEYDYSTSLNVTNNWARTNNTITKGIVDYYYGKTGHESEPIGTGKATLRRVQHIAYDEAGAAINLPSYEFKYWGDYDAAKYNPAYNKDMVDQWGNYVKNSKIYGTGKNTVAYYNHYPELLKTDADDNARVFNMMKIELPSGGSMNIDYQAQSYGKVEDKTPYVMRHVKSITKQNPDDENNPYSVAKVDITDIINDLGGSGNLQSAKVLNVGDVIYGEIAFYQENNVGKDAGNIKSLDESRLYMSSSDSVMVFSLSSVTHDLVDNKWYQDVVLQNIISKLSSIAAKYRNPFLGDCEIHMYTESAQMRSLKESLNGCTGANTALDKYLDMEKETAWVALKKIVANVRNVFRTESNWQGQQFDPCFGHPGSAIFSGLSFLRTPIYKGRYTGSAVSKIELKDNFNYATMTNGNPGPDDNSYGTKYFYDETGDGKGVSSGVASIEPGGGKSCVLDVYHLKGAGFAPGPQVISSKTTMENMYYADNPNAVAGDKVSRKKGKTIYEFYTAKDDGLRFSDNFREGGNATLDGKPHGYLFLFGIIVFLKIKIPVKKFIPIPVFTLPCIVRCNRHDNYFVKGYSYTDNTDVFGRPKSIIQMDASGEELGRQTFSYYGMDEPVNMYKDNFNAPNAKQKPGKMDQVWSEAYFTKESKISMVSWLLTLNAETDRNLCYTNMKYSYIPPTLKEVTSTIDGLETVTTNTGFDYYTGTPIEVRSNDSYKNTKIVRTVPAYWKYSEMGAATAATPNYINNLTATTGTYMYLNQVDNNHLLGAGIVEWSSNTTSNTWNLIDYVQPKKHFISPTSFKYDYALISGITIKSNYQNPTLGSNKYVQKNSVVFKTYKGYTYETDLRAKGSMDGGNPNMPTDGTFTSFTDFNYPSGVGNVSNWKLLSTNQLYSANGVLIQSKDILNKYASQLLGYNFSNTVGAVSNASFGASVHEGAENTYINVAGKKMLEGDRVQLQGAEVIKACDKTFTEKTLDLTNFPKDNAVPQHTLGHIITINNLAAPVYNTPFAVLSVTYTNGLKRYLNISLNDNGEYQVTSSSGEAFDGFFEFKQSSTSTQLIFNPNDFSSFSYTGHFGSNTSVNLALNGTVPSCTVTTKKYKIPDNDCLSEVHTGSYAFKLTGEGNEVGNIGTMYTLSPLTVTADEFKRKYKAMVWVHASSPNQTELVVQKATGNLVTSKATPYAKAGNWVLLRLDFDLSNENYISTNQVQVFVRNYSAQGNSIYDDLRILPYHADMTNWVFEHQFNRVVSGLDNDNFASYSNYDARGRVMESAVELQDVGKNTVQKFLYNDQKKQ